MHCGWLRCHVVWFEMVVWGELEDDLVIRTTQIYSVLHSTTKYYSGTTPCTTKYAFARREAPTSPNAVPATQGDSHE